VVINQNFVVVFGIGVGAFQQHCRAGFRAG
jgi:hypothetical protein